MPFAPSYPYTQGFACISLARAEFNLVQLMNNAGSRPHYSPGFGVLRACVNRLRFVPRRTAGSLSSQDGTDTARLLAEGDRRIQIQALEDKAALLGFAPGACCGEDAARVLARENGFVALMSGCMSAHQLSL